MGPRIRFRLLYWILPLSLLVAPGRSASGEVVRLAPGPEHGTTLLPRLLYGRRHSRLWVTPFRVRLLEFDSSTEGLTPVPAGPDSVPDALLLRGADSCLYAFRLLDPGHGEPASLPQRLPLVRGFLPDAVASVHPAASLISSALLQAAGVLHPHPRLVAMPADTLLGAARSRFGGHLGILEEALRPGPGPHCGIPGATRIAGTGELIRRLESGPEDRVDERAYLTARLVDFLLGDFDRDPVAWRWAAFKGDSSRIWRPVSSVADRSLSKVGGLIHIYSRASSSPFYGGQAGDAGPAGAAAPPRSEDLDHRLFAGMDRQDWDSVIAALSSRLPDSVLDSVVNEMPPEMRPSSAAELSRTLAGRRDAMPSFAAAYYLRLSEDVDVWTTEAPALIVIGRPDDRHLELDATSRWARGGAPRPYFHRRFDSEETREVRLYMCGGQDRVVVRGPGRDGITLRIVSLGQANELVDSSAAGGVHLYDPAGNTRIGGITDVVVDRRPYPVLASLGDSAGASFRARDFGSFRVLTRWQNSGHFTGFFLGAQYSLERFGFRQSAYASRTNLRAGFSLTLGEYEVQASHEVRRANSGLSARLLMRASTLDVTDFYGFGNESRDSLFGAGSYYRARLIRYQAQPSATLEVSRQAALTVGVPITLVQARSGSSAVYVGTLRPYGWGSYARLGGQLGLRFGEPRLPAHALAPAAPEPQLSLLGSYYPGMWGLATGFGSLEGSAALGVGAATPSQPVLALILGGKRNWGRYPFDEAAVLGGRATLLGFAEQRFAGDASVYGECELNVRLVRLNPGVPGDLGVLVLAESGRVFLEGESSTRWHSGAGGGLWFTPRDTRDRLSLTFVRSETRSGFYARGTLGF